MNAIFKLINPSNTITVNRPLAHSLGLNEAIIYGALISKFYYYSERGMLDDGWFYSTAPDLDESTALSEKQQKRAVDNLVRAGLIRCELRGMPAKRSFYIVEDIDTLQKLIAAGEARMNEIKPAAAERYERKHQTSEPKPETQSLIDFLSAGFGTAAPESESPSAEFIGKSEEYPTQNAREAALYHCSDKRAEQAPPKGQSLLRQKVGASSSQTSKQLFSKSNINNPDLINPSVPRACAGNDSNDSADSDRIDEIDLQTERETYFSILKENIGYDELCRQYKYIRDEVDELIAIMLDVVCSTKQTVRVNGEELPKEVVKGAFLKLDESHIDYVLTALRKNTSDVRNIRSYLITALYNAPQTIGSYYRAWGNHDIKGGNAQYA